MSLFRPFGLKLRHATLKEKLEGTETQDLTRGNLSTSESAINTKR